MEHKMPVICATDEVEADIGKNAENGNYGY